MEMGRNAEQKQKVTMMVDGSFATEIPVSMVRRETSARAVSGRPIFNGLA